MGFLITKVEKGYALAEAIPSFDYYNPIGSVHGGYAATLMDTVLGVSVHTMMDKGQGYTTLEFKISFIKAITKDTGPDPRRRPRAELRPPRRDCRSASAGRERTGCSRTRRRRAWCSIFRCRSVKAPAEGAAFALARA